MTVRCLDCILPATRLSEVRDWSELCVYRTPPEPAVVEVLDRLVRILLLLELDVDVADEVIAEVVAHVHLLDGPVLVLALHEHVLEEVVVVFLQRMCI